ncbi:hypothetical protein [Pseudonocardia phyllosphaerae]|uniref:hypothetical protein n=1 Tax=Pseudonocardia phyllosphaerae TaxID=3390502 RepID=UPI00397E603F
MSRRPRAVRAADQTRGGSVASRRQVLRIAATAVAATPLLASCKSDSGGNNGSSEPLLGMADQARMDASMIAAAVTSDPKLAERLEPLRAARMEHATALDAAAGRTPGEAPVPATPQRASLADVRDAVDASARTAGEVVNQAPAMQAGLVAEIAACCSTYAGILT